MNLIHPDLLAQLGAQRQAEFLREAEHDRRAHEAERAAAEHRGRARGGRLFVLLRRRPALRPEG